jgi:transcriptional regulator with XRE-family HTH domain/Zn-dependent peptidase ImmA (M78 family)
MNLAIGMRISALRREHGLSQDELAGLFGFRDRQTVSAIETGVRRVTASELLLVAEKFNVPLEYFTDPFRLDGEVAFSWRQRDVGQSVLSEYEQMAGRWIGAYRRLATLTGRRAPLMRQALGLTRHSRVEDAMEAGERFVAEFDLGGAPAQRLAEVMQNRLGILVLMVDSYQGISGAACRLPEFDTVLIARRDTAARRNFDLAHELFHILTWEAMPPGHVEDAGDIGRTHVEKLANHFAGAVLMPAAALREFDDCGQWSMDHLIARLNAAADELQVTSSALRWRLVALRKLKRVVARAVPDTVLRNNGGRNRATLPLLFSRPFVEVVALAIDEGHVSVRRAAQLMGLPIDALEELFADHGVDCQIDL